MVTAGNDEYFTPGFQKDLLTKYWFLIPNVGLESVEYISCFRKRETNPPVPAHRKKFVSFKLRFTAYLCCFVLLSRGLLLNCRRGRI